MGEEPVVTMFSRRTCGLCDEARAVVLAELRRVRFQFDEVTIDGDDALEIEFGLRVPVVLVNGQEQFEITVDPQRLRHLVSEAARYRRRRTNRHDR